MTVPCSHCFGFGHYTSVKGVAHDCPQCGGYGYQNTAAEIARSKKITAAYEVWTCGNSPKDDTLLRAAFSAGWQACLKST
jgi:hypothetical protein